MPRRSKICNEIRPKRRNKGGRIQLITYVKIIGPPLLKAIKALEKMAINQEQVCILDTMLFYDLPTRGMHQTANYFKEVGPISQERCDSIISKSGMSLGGNDFYFEWFKEPSNKEFTEFIQEIDTTLKPVGVRYSITSRGAKKLSLDLSEIEIVEEIPESSTSGGYFEVYRGKDKQWRFRLKAANHKIIAVSEGYSSKTGCMNGIASVKKNADSEIYDLTS